MRLGRKRWERKDWISDVGGHGVGARENSSREVEGAIGIRLRLVWKQR